MWTMQDLGLCFRFEIGWWLFGAFDLIQAGMLQLETGWGFLGPWLDLGFYAGWRLGVGAGFKLEVSLCRGFYASGLVICECCRLGALVWSLTQFVIFDFVLETVLLCFYVKVWRVFIFFDISASPYCVDNSLFYIFLSSSLSPVSLYFFHSLSPLSSDLSI